MGTCDFTQGISKGCNPNSSGIVEVYIGNYPTGYTGTEWLTETGGTATGMSGVSFYTFEFPKNSSNWTDEATITVEKSTASFKHMVSMYFPKNDADKRNMIYTMAYANMIAIVKDKNDKYFLLGPQCGLSLDTGAFASGTAPGDGNGWNISLSSDENKPAFEVSSSIISGLLAD